MAVFLFILLAILLFWAFADMKMFRAFIPLIITSIFVRFLEQFIVIDWFQFIHVCAEGEMKFWSPIMANLTVWPVSGYLFIQYMPKRRRLLYALGWCGGLILYLHMLKWTNLIKLTPKWYLYLSPLTVGIFFGTIYAVWRWLYPTASQERRAAYEP
jgi:Mpv17 / PMP22 family